MEPADIDWKTVESRYVRDDLYEHINAPKWIDLTVPNAISVDDEAWFCRPDCKHPKTFEDFQRCSPSPKKKLTRSISEQFPLGEKNGRDAALKRRGGIAAAFLSSPQKPKKPAAKKQFAPDAENQDPNTRPAAAATAAGGGKAAKEAIKSSAEKGGEEWKSKKPPPKLRSTMSARNLFSGKDILSQISEFCNELKKLASRKERSAAAEAVSKRGEEEKQALLGDVAVGEEEKGNLNLDSKNNDSPVKKLGKMQLKIEAEQDTVTNLNSKKNDGPAKKMSRMPLRVETDKENKKDNNSSVLREVRAHPPTPQRFPSPMNRQPRKTKASVTATAITGSPLISKPPRCAALGRGVLQELEQCRDEKKGMVEMDDESNRVSGALEAEGKADVFWFLKPCSYMV